MSLHLKATMMKISDPVCCSYLLTDPAHSLSNFEFEQSFVGLPVFFFVHVFLLGQFHVFNFVLVFSSLVASPAARVAPPQIMFGHAVTVFFKDVFAKHAALFKQLNVNANNGFGDVVAKIKTLPEEQRKAVEADIDAAYKSRPALAMVWRLAVSVEWVFAMRIRLLCDGGFLCSAIDDSCAL